MRSSEIHLSDLSVLPYPIRVGVCLSSGVNLQNRHRTQRLGQSASLTCTFVETQITSSSRYDAPVQHRLGYHCCCQTVNYQSSILHRHQPEYCSKGSRCRLETVSEQFRAMMQTTYIDSCPKAVLRRYGRRCVERRVLGAGDAVVRAKISDAKERGASVTRPVSVTHNQQ